jgi:hypothetical protein
MLYIILGVKPIIFLMQNIADQTCVNAEKRISEYKANCNNDILKLNAYLWMQLF